MNIIKCPECRKMIDSASIKNSQKHSNPFKRRVIRCNNCQAHLQITRVAFILFWLSIIFGVYSMFFYVEYVRYIMFSLFVILITLFLTGHSHERRQINK